MRAFVVTFLLVGCSPAPTPAVSPPCVDCVEPPTDVCASAGWQLSDLGEPGISGDNAIAVVGREVHLLATVEAAPRAPLQLVHYWAPIGSTSWQREVVVTSPGDLLDLSATDARGELAISYGILEGEVLRQHFAWRAAGGWIDVRGPVRTANRGNRGLATDRAGRVHTSFVAPGGGLHHATASRDGHVEVEAIFDGPWASSLVLDDEDVPHVVYVDADDVVGHAQPGPDGWVREDLGRGNQSPPTPPTIAADSEGTLHLAMPDIYTGVAYFRRVRGEDWQLGPMPALEPAWQLMLSIASGAGASYIAYMTPDSSPAVTRLDGDAPGLPVAGPSLEYHLLVDGLGAQHLVLQAFAGQKLQYAYRCR